jgi:hypothetical protein
MTRTTGAGLLLAACVLGLAACGTSDDAEARNPAPGSSSASPTFDVPDVDPGKPCPALLGDDGLVALALGGLDLDEDERAQVQDALFEIVLAGPADLQDPAGQLVDYLDDPPEYQPLDGGPDDIVTAAATAIRTGCA